MNHTDVTNVKDSNERVTSVYSEIYYENEYCDNQPKNYKNTRKIRTKHVVVDQCKDEWISPSDLLIGTVVLKPPFTSKIFRGKAHEGLLAIGNSDLESERLKFLKSLKRLLCDNNASWEFILKNEINSINKKVNNIYKKKFIKKRDIMNAEMVKFYETSLKELEDNVKSEVETVQASAYAKIISNTNIEIKEKLKIARMSLEKKLKTKYYIELKKINEYYALLLANELKRYSQLKNYVLVQRNDAIKAYFKQMEAEKLTSAMYILSMERKKCRIKKMLLEKYQNAEILEEINKLEDKQMTLDMLKEKEVSIPTLNERWEAKIKKVLQLFLKFISFSLKLLPEQASFLLDLEKMVILQLNEIQKNPEVSLLILIDDANIFKFEKSETKPVECFDEPFVLVGDLSTPETKKYGSTETLPSDIDLPFVRIGRQYIYAKCHGYEEIKKMLDQQICKCRQPSFECLPLESVVSEPKLPEIINTNVETESSDEKIIFDDFKPYKECPIRKCCKRDQRDSFPFLASYLDYSEENYKRVKTILPYISEKSVAPELLKARDIAYKEVPFSVTKEVKRSVGTQCSSQEDLDVLELSCPCIQGNFQCKNVESINLQKAGLENFNEIFNKRKVSLNRMLADHPKLLELFGDEKYDYKM